MLRREAIVDGEDVHSGVTAKNAAWRVVRIEIAEHESAAVKEDEKRCPLATLRSIVPRLERACGADDLEVANATNAYRATCDQARRGG